MRSALRWLGVWGSGAIVMGVTTIVQAEPSLFVAYPPDGHKTTAAHIFLIGTAPAQGTVTVNGQTIERSRAGHFAPSFPLQMGENLFTVRYQNQELTVHVQRSAAEPASPTGAAFAVGSLTPAVDLARLPNEPICFAAIAPSQATVSVSLNQQTIALLPQPSAVTLPPNAAVLTRHNQPIAASAETYRGCWTTAQVGDLGLPTFRLTLNGKTIEQPGKGRITILSPAQPQVVAVTAEAGTARTGPSTDYSRLTPLPKGSSAAVTGREGDWLRLDYGAWIKAAETRVIPDAAAPQTLIRSVRARQVDGWTEIAFPLQTTVPVSVQQGDRSFTLTLYDTTAQTDIVALDDDPLIRRLDWQQTAPGQLQYTFRLKSDQQWGYKLRYEGTTLILSLRHPPVVSGRQPLSGVKILLDPGHGGPEDLGSQGPTGYPEKSVTLTVANLLRDRLLAQGATVYMTRTGDVDLYPQDRAALIEQLQPTIALSLHYNALPDDGDAQHTAGVGAFWYNAQAHSLAVFLHNYLVKRLDRPSYGVFWDNLALTRPTVAPAVLLELGFMTNPDEFEWVTDPAQQQRLADALANGITQWIKNNQ